MIVADVQALLLAAMRFAEAAGTTTKPMEKLAEACQALEPFKPMDVAAFASLIRQAEEYRATGILPVATKAPKRSPRKTGPSAEEEAARVNQLAKQLKDLYAVVHEDTVGFGAIDEICSTIGSLSKPEALEVAKGFEIKINSKTSRDKAIDEIRRKLMEQKGSAQRIQPIASH